MSTCYDVEKTMAALRQNNMKASLVADRAAAKALVESIIPKNASVAYGGSVTLTECGIDEMLRGGNYAFHDRFQPGASPEELEEIFKQIKTCDYFLMSSNAITESGMLYNVDGMANRISCLVHGPKNVIIVAGVNKIVATIDEAVERVRNVAAPLNARRLACDTPCSDAGLCCDCLNVDRICCNYLVSAYQKIKDRVHVVFVDETLGY